MKTFIGLLIAMVVVAVTTDAEFAIPLKLGWTIPLTAVETLTLLGVLGLAMLFRVPRLVQPGTIVSATVETLMIYAILFFPLLIGLLWVSFDFKDVLQPFLFIWFIFAVMVLMFQLSLFGLNNGWLQFGIKAAFLVYLASVFNDLLYPQNALALWIDRPSGFIVNPNGGAAQLDLLLALILPWQKPRVSGYIWILLALAGVAITFSRSGLGQWGLVAAAYTFMLMRYGTRSARVASAVVVGGAVWTVISLFAILPLILTKEDAERFNFNRIANIVSLLQGNGDQITEDARFKLLVDYTHRAEQSPILGHGTMYSIAGYGLPLTSDDRGGPHNMWIARWVDEGILGVLSLVLFHLLWFVFFMVHRWRAGIVLTASFFFMTFFSHNMDEFQFELVLFVIAAAQALEYSQSSNGAFSILSLNRKAGAPREPTATSAAT